MFFSFVLKMGGLKPAHVALQLLGLTLMLRLLLGALVQRVLQSLNGFGHSLCLGIRLLRVSNLPSIAHIKNLFLEI